MKTRLTFKSKRAAYRLIGVLINPCVVITEEQKDEFRRLICNKRLYVSTLSVTTARFNEQGAKSGEVLSVFRCDFMESATLSERLHCKIRNLFEAALNRMGINTATIVILTNN